MLRATLYLASLVAVATSSTALPIPFYSGGLDLLPLTTSLANHAQRGFTLGSALAPLRIVDDDEEHLTASPISDSASTTGRSTSHASLRALVEPTPLAAPVQSSAAASSARPSRVDAADDSIFSEADLPADIHLGASAAAGVQSKAAEIERARQLKAKGWSTIGKRELGKLKEAAKRSQQLRARTAAVVPAEA